MSEIKNTFTPILEPKQIAPFSDDKFPIVAAGLPTAFACDDIGDLARSVDKKSPELRWTYFTPQLAQLIAESGCNIAQAMMFAEPSYPPHYLPGLSDEEVDNYFAKKFKDDPKAIQNAAISLENLALAGVYLMVRHDNASSSYISRFKKSVELFKDSDKVYGWMGIDEPCARGETVEALKDGKIVKTQSHRNFARVREVTDAIKAQESAVNAPKRPVYNNLFPSYATDAQLAGTTDSDSISLGRYRDYLNQFKLVCNPDIWSYDNYHLGYQSAPKDESSTHNNLCIDPAFFKNMLMMRYVSIMSGKPFWTTIYSYEESAFRNPGKVSRLSLPSFRLQAFSSIAMGAKGLMYWKLITQLYYGQLDKDIIVRDPQHISVPRTSSAQWLYPEAPIMTDAIQNIQKPKNTTSWRPYLATNNQAKQIAPKQVLDFDVFPNYRVFPYVQKVNEEIHQFGHLFTKGNVTDVRCTNPAFKFPAGTTSIESCKYLPPFTSSFMPDMSIHSVVVNTDGSGIALSPVLLSKLECQGNVYVIMVNLNYNNTCKVTVNFGCQTTCLNPRSDAEASGNESGKFNMIMEAADWRIFELS